MRGPWCDDCQTWHTGGCDCEDPAEAVLAEVGPEPVRAFPSADDVEDLEALHQDTVERILAGTMDSRDLTPPPPAYLDPVQVLRMRAMVKDAAANGDREWPYGRTA